MQSSKCRKFKTSHTNKHAILKWFLIVNKLFISQLISKPLKLNLLFFFDFINPLVFFPLSLLLLSVSLALPYFPCCADNRTFLERIDSLILLCNSFLNGSHFAFFTSRRRLIDFFGNYLFNQKLGCFLFLNYLRLVRRKYLKISNSRQSFQILRFLISQHLHSWVKRRQRTPLYNLFNLLLLLFLLFNDFLTLF